MPMFYRFELAISGEPQGCGFLTGISALSGDVMDEEYCEELTKFFDENLPIPHIIRPCVFWFTEAGLKIFGPAINDLIPILEEYNCEILGTVIGGTDIPPDYEDQFQVAWPISAFEKEPIYTTIRSIEDLIYSR